MSFTPKLWVATDPITAAELNRLEDAMEYVVNGPVVLNAQSGTAYTLVLADAGKLVTLSNANAITLTVPLNATEAFDVGTVVALAQAGAGLVTVAPAVGVTIRSVSSLVSLAGQYATASLTKLATDEWLLSGGLV